MELKSAILVVDDDANLASNLEHILELEGYQAVVANDGQMALTLCREMAFALGIIDIKLPDMSGVELIGKLAELSPTMEYIISTGYASLETAIEAVGQGRVVAYETKPLSMDYILSLIRQVTERQRAEESLRESEERYRSLFKNMLSGYAFCKMLFDAENNPLDFIYIDVNDAFEKLTGLRKEDIIGKRVTEAIPSIKDLNPEIIPIYGEVVLTGRPTAFEVFFKPLGMWLALSVYRPRKDHFVAVLDNITEHKQADKALEAQKELTDRILASTPNAILVIDGDLEIMLANRAFYEIFNMKGGEAEGRQVGDVLPIAGLDEAISRTLAEKSPQLDLEFSYETESGEMILLTQITPMAGEEVLLILRDVTAERAREAQLHYIDRLVSIGEVAAGVAHELNNPLASVVGYSELVLAGEIPQEVKSDVEVIHNNAQRAATIVRNLLAFARRQEPQQQCLSINDLIRHVLEMRGYELKVGNIEVITELADELPEVLADPQQLEQVFLNIILNAEQAMLEAHKGGTLTVRTEIRRGMVRITFSDDGPGIPEENLRRVFNPFFTTKAPGKGTGLGLSICYGIVTQHNGRIYAESKLGEGATFFVELPLAEENTS